MGFIGRFQLFLWVEAMGRIQKIDTMQPPDTKKKLFSVFSIENIPQKHSRLFPRHLFDVEIAFLSQQAGKILVFVPKKNPDPFQGLLNNFVNQRS